MRAIIAGIVIAGTLIAPVGAQGPSSQPTQNSPSAITQDNPDPSKPTPGANSFVEGQARALIESKGFKNVSTLMNDREGIWRGTAVRDGDTVDVSVDFQGKVVATAHGGGGQPVAQEKKP